MRIASRCRVVHPDPWQCAIDAMIAEIQREIAAVRTEFEKHLRTASADALAALAKSTEVLAHN